MKFSEIPLYATFVWAEKMDDSGHSVCFKSHPNSYIRLDTNHTDGLIPKFFRISTEGYKNEFDNDIFSCEIYKHKDSESV